MEAHDHRPEDDKGPLPAVASAALARLVPGAFGVACGTVAGLGVLVATAVLVVRGGETVGPHLGLLSQYLPGYTVSATGAFVGALWCAALGFVGGYLFAILRNLAVAAWLRYLLSRYEHHVASDLLDRMS